jgi:alkanesulfonate monooxygenase SsuD/methylene tetrahydromethanopterin reductase-like flavin-dependent oxidoreductase (luciferase family)
MRERILAMKEIWTQSKPKYAGDFVKFDEMMQWPKPVQKPHPPIVLGGAFPWAARRAVRYGDGWFPNANSGDPEDYIPKFNKMAEEAGRKPLPISMGGAPMDVDKLKRLRDLGIERVSTSVMSEPADQILPILDKWAGLMRQVNG